MLARGAWLIGVLGCCLASSWTLQAQDSSQPQVPPPAFRLPQDHPGFGVPYHDKNYDYWRRLDDDQWDIDHDAGRFEDDFSIGVYDNDPSYIDAVILGRVAGQEQDSVFNSEFLGAGTDDYDSPLVTVLGVGLLTMGFIVFVSIARSDRRV